MSSSSSSAVAATSAATAAASEQPAGFKVVGIILAIVSGLLIGSSFVFKKKGLIAAQQGGAAGEGVGYLKSPMWWTGMTMMIIGELCNFGAYAFIPAIIVTPLGALSVVICAILSSIFLKETLTFFGWIGCFLCIVGSVIIALNGPAESSAATIKEFQKLFLSVGFIVYGSMIILAALVIIFFIAPKWGKKSMLWYILICSLFGGLSVSCTQGLGSSIVTSVRGDNQFKYWFIYFLLVFVVCTLVTEIYYLNVALALFNTAMVTPTYYVIFTFFTLVTSVILYEGLHATPVQIVTVVLGFLVICAGITILQMSKVDPSSLKGLDRKSTILLQASRQHTGGAEKSDLSAVEEPGMDALRGSFGALGSMIRARSVRQMSQSSGSPGRRHRRARDEETGSGGEELSTRGLANLPRTQLYDAPVPRNSSTLPTLPEDGSEADIRTASATIVPSVAGVAGATLGEIGSPRSTKIRFGESETTHFYPSPGKRGTAVHSQRPAHLMSDLDETDDGDGDNDDDAFDPSRLQRTPQPASDRFVSHNSGSGSNSPQRRPDPFRQDSNPFAGGPSDSETNLLSSVGSGIGSGAFRGEDMYEPEMGSQEEMESRRSSYHGRAGAQHRAYPGGGDSSSEDEREARESLVAHDSGSTRGGIRLIPQKSASPRKF